MREHQVRCMIDDGPRQTRADRDYRDPTRQDRYRPRRHNVKKAKGWQSARSNRLES